MKKKEEYYHGFIYPVVKFAIELLREWINPVEWFKRLVCWKWNLDTLPPKCRNIAIDLFIVMKYLLVLISIIRGYRLFWIVIYLLIFNVFTYFYYHCWRGNDSIDHERQKRRFIALISSFLFNILCFAYLYTHYWYSYFDHISKGFIWQGLNLSISASFSGSSYVTPNNNIGYWINLVQLIITFIYVAFMLSQSVPIIGGKEEKGGLQK